MTHQMYKGFEGLATRKEKPSGVVAVAQSGVLQMLSSAASLNQSGAFSISCGGFG
jgi:hypothetical protein